MDVPTYLTGTFRTLENYGYRMRLKYGKDTKRYTRFDEENLSLYLEIRTRNDGRWIRISPSHARREEEKLNPPMGLCGTSNNNSNPNMMPLGRSRQQQQPQQQPQSSMNRTGTQYVNAPFMQRSRSANTANTARNQASTNQQPPAAAATSQPPGKWTPAPHPSAGAASVNAPPSPLGGPAPPIVEANEDESMNEYES